MNIIAAGKIIFTTIPRVLISCLKIGFVSKSHALMRSIGQASDFNMSRNLSVIQSVSSLYDYNPFTGLSCVLAVHSHSLGKHEYTAMMLSIVYLSGSFTNRVGTCNYTNMLTNNGKTASLLQNFTTYSIQTGVKNIEFQLNGSNGSAYLNFTIYNGQNSPNSNMGISEIVVSPDVADSVAINRAAMVIRTKL